MALYLYSRFKSLNFVLRYKYFLFLLKKTLQNKLKIKSIPKIKYNLHYSL